MKKLYSSRNANEIAMLQKFLRQHGIPVTVAERGDTLELLLIQSGYEAAARELIQEFKDNPPELEPYSPSEDAGPGLVKLLSKQAGIFTFLMFIAVLGVAFFQWFISDERTIGLLMYTPMGINTIELSEPWRLVTPILMHFSATHLIFNLFWWWYLGGRIELTYGSRALVAITIFSALVSNFAQWYTSGPLFGGLSGVVYALLGFCMIESWGRRSALFLPPALYVFMIGWLFLGYTDLLWVNVANEAHLLGLISGIVAGFAARAVYSTRSR